MTATQDNLTLIALSFTKSETYPNLSIDTIRQIIRQVSGATDRRQFFRYLQMIQSQSKETSRFVFDVSNFCNSQIRGQEVLN